jgi:hypothetical protein
MEQRTQGSSVILVEKGDSAPIPNDLVPLEGVQITAYHSPEDAHQTNEATQVWRNSTESEAGGTFDTGGVCAPGSYDMAVGATRDGCQPVLQTFQHSNRHSEQPTIWSRRSRPARSFSVTLASSRR